MLLSVGWWIGAESQVPTGAKNLVAPGDLQVLADTVRGSWLGLGTWVWWGPHHCVPRSSNAERETEMLRMRSSANPTWLCTLWLEPSHAAGQDEAGGTHWPAPGFSVV